MPEPKTQRCFQRGTTWKHRPGAEPGPKTGLAECSNSSAHPHSHNPSLFWTNLSHKAKSGEFVSSWHCCSSSRDAVIVPAQGGQNQGPLPNYCSVRVAEHRWSLSPALLDVPLTPGLCCALAAEPKGSSLRVSSRC